MPTRDVIYDLDGTVYVEDEDGQGWHPIHHEVTLSVGDKLIYGYMNDDISTGLLSASFDFRVPKDMARVFFQQIAMMPNNWLKMHGLPMRRRAKA